MPMLFVIQHGGNFVSHATNPQNIIYLVCRLMDIVRQGNDYYFSDGHCADKFTSFYDRGKLSELPVIINWDAIRTTYWGGNENLNVKRQKQAEFLAAGDIPAVCIAKFICYNESAKIKPDAYY
jgi:hypothetical protein